MRKILWVAFLVSLFPLGSPSAVPSELSPEGWGATKIGMTPTEVEKSLGLKLTLSTAARGSDSCIDAWVGNVRAPKPPVSFRFVDGRLAVIGLRDNSIATDKGIRIGDPESKVLEAYGPNLKREPAPYFDATDPQHNLYFWLSANRGLLFWIDEHGKVHSIQAGTKALELIEGCA